MWEDIEVIECLGERGEIIDATKQTRMIDGQRQERWLSSRGNENRQESTARRLCRAN